jgi:hypothetical protein
MGSSNIQPNWTCASVCQSGNVPGPISSALVLATVARGIDGVIPCPIKDPTTLATNIEISSDVKTIFFIFSSSFSEFSLVKTAIFSQTLLKIFSFVVAECPKKERLENFKITRLS